MSIEASWINQRKNRMKRRRDRLPGNDDDADSLSAANGDGAADDDRFSFDLAFSVALFCSNVDSGCSECRIQFRLIIL